jgi:hypothetical protein
VVQHAANVSGELDHLDYHSDHAVLGLHDHLPQGTAPILAISVCLFAFSISINFFSYGHQLNAD